MKRIGVRELRQNASEHLRLVQKGERIEITDRGRPIAMLVPMAQEGSRFDLLEAQGRLSPDMGDLLALGVPPAPSASHGGASIELNRMREHER